MHASTIAPRGGGVAAVSTRGWLGFGAWLRPWPGWPRILASWGHAVSRMLRADRKIRASVEAARGSWCVSYALLPCGKARAARHGC
ncbi:hypothetical protein AKJ09_09490 [Labilithrix luteola]|uniref:Uncharacterized protein n=1 Tax=Labilithrix luteola TaxID=1391654 RepID=A0A0K1QAY9_9BACT|nr:hypothetical protein AKJ09_09490 [Labilithrix luteola]